MNVLCAFKDKKSNLFTAPMTFSDLNSSLRYFDSMSEKDVNICDYDLYYLGVYDDVTCKIQLVDPELVRSGDFYYEKINDMKDYHKQLGKALDVFKKETDLIFEFMLSILKEYEDSFYDFEVNKTTLLNMFNEFKMQDLISDTKDKKGVI